MKNHVRKDELSQQGKHGFWLIRCGRNRPPSRTVAENVVGFKIRRRKACQFESGRGHQGLAREQALTTSASRAHGASAKTLLATLAAAVLTACGGGGSPDSAHEQPAATCTAPTIQLFGDSTLDEPLGAAPYWIAKWGARVTNRAVGGTNSRELRAGLDGKNLPWPGSVQADVVVINHGLRDGYTPFPAAFTPLAEYRDNLRFFAAHSAGARVIFQAPNPSTKEGRDMAPYAQAMREVAAEVGSQVIDVYACFQQQADWRARIPDGTHPDAEGLRYIVNVCAAPVIEALPCR